MPYVDPEIIAEVKRVDLLTYLQEREPDELVRISPGVYCTKEHDSLKISNGKWFWWSRGLGGLKINSKRGEKAKQHQPTGGRLEYGPESQILLRYQRNLPF